MLEIEYVDPERVDIAKMSKALTVEAEFIDDALRALSCPFDPALSEDRSIIFGTFFHNQTWAVEEAVLRRLLISRAAQGEKFDLEKLRIAIRFLARKYLLELVSAA